MMKGKFKKSTESKVRKLSIGTIALLLVAVLALGGAIGGTLAWLIGNPASISNTFVVGNIGLEIKGDGFSVPDKNTNDLSYNNGYFIAGETKKTDQKNPDRITIEEGSVGCYLFIETIRSKGFSDVMDYHLAEHWTKLGVETTNSKGQIVQIYYYNGDLLENVLAKDVDISIYHTDRAFTAKSTFEKEILPEYQFDIKGYAIQRATGTDENPELGFTGTIEEQHTQAWAAIKDAENYNHNPFPS